MNDRKRMRLRAAGFGVGEVKDLLRLSDAEVAFIDIKLALTDLLRSCRVERELTQAEVARRVGSSQSRIAKMESGDPTVTVDLVLRTLLALDVSPPEVGRAISATIEQPVPNR